MEKQNKEFDANSRFTGVGQIIAILGTAEHHKNRTVEDIVLNILPAVMNNQFVVGFTDAQISRGSETLTLRTPTSFFTWASVDSSTHDLLLKNPDKRNLLVKKYSSGKNIWLVDSHGSENEMDILQKHVKERLHLPSNYQFNRIKN